MPLSWNDIKTRAQSFVNEWKNENNEDAEAKTFWDDFFRVFGVQRRRLAAFEYHVKKLDNKAGYVDLFWPGMLIVEHKSRGKSLDKAHGQVLDYFHGIPEAELPKYILVSDFANFRLYDLDNGSQLEFPLEKLVEHIHAFGFIAGYQKRTYKEQDPVNIKAAEVMGRLHDKLKAIGYEGHQLELYLVRLLFCLFADDTGIFEEKGIYHDYLELKTTEDGSDLAARIGELFQVLNTPGEKRFKNIDETLDAFPYVNGKLFEEHLNLASFDREMRQLLLDCCKLDWGKISPAIFGSLFQSVMDEKARRNLGAHYTSEKNIMKVIKPLFLDDLYKEYDSVKSSKAKLAKFHDKISQLRFLDPACGCGNFLIIAYRELRLLEIEIIKQRLKIEGFREESAREAQMDVTYLVKCDVDMFYGIEYEEFPAQIAQVAMWLIDHQMNLKVSEAFGNYYVRLPLKKSATIIHGNALRIDWQSLIEPMPWEKGEAKFDYIMGNPPFVGHQWRTKEQIEDMTAIFGDAKRAGRLDYVTAWYIQAAKYLQTYNTESSFLKTKVAFVSTNSIVQGEQVSILWTELFNKYNIKIHFAHRTFKWSNEAKGNAGVHVVIIGFGNYGIAERKIYEYSKFGGDPHEVFANNINAYLVDGKDIFIENRGKAVHKYPQLNKGSQPTDGGHLILISKDEFLLNEPKASAYVKRYMGAEDFIDSRVRWCLWLKNVDPSELKNMPFVIERLEKVSEVRLNSPTPSVRKFADFPTLFTQDRQPMSDYLVIPEVSSENRKYIPIGFENKDVICANTVQVIAEASVYMYGVLQSFMHMVWTKLVAGRLESRIRYTPAVYNNFPWPENPSEKQVKAVEEAAQHVLDVRAQFPESSLADLYDPNTMPPALVKAHQALDKAVDLCYRPQPFPSETKRIEFLFELYEKYTAGMFAEEKKTKKSKKSEKSKESKESKES